MDKKMTKAEKIDFLVKDFLKVLDISIYTKMFLSEQISRMINNRWYKIAIDEAYEYYITHAHASINKIVGYLTNNTYGWCNMYGKYYKD